jgi:hypothetical protein
MVIEGILAFQQSANPAFWHSSVLVFIHMCDHFRMHVDWVVSVMLREITKHLAGIYVIFAC